MKNKKRIENLEARIWSLEKTLGIMWLSFAKEHSSYGEFSRIKSDIKNLDITLDVLNEDFYRLIDYLQVELEHSETKYVKKEEQDEKDK